eukprot:SRR837773.3916.p1 GENE.SRR837773.3916~~SRR837773.3916.p1  ORF type:complete len:221 (-),score=31.77 SRR837773.3916:88-750(-)
MGDAAPPAKVPRVERECAICVSSFPLEHFPGKVTEKCEHVRDVCRDCMARTIEAEVNGKGNSTRVVCPHEGCSGILEYEDVRREATKEVFESFDRTLLRQMLQWEPSFRWCSHPSCGSGQLVEDLNAGDVGWNKFLRCHACNRRTCVYHKCVWHTERTCQQYEADARGSDEVALLQFSSARALSAARSAATPSRRPGLRPHDLPPGGRRLRRGVLHALPG